MALLVSLVKFPPGYSRGYDGEVVCIVFHVKQWLISDMNLINLLKFHFIGILGILWILFNPPIAPKLPKPLLDH